VRRSGADRYWWIWVAVVPILVWTAIRLFGLEGGYPLVAMMAFTPYVAIAALFIVGIALALRNWAAATLATLAMLCLSAVILPRTIGSSTAEAAGHETLTVLAANVHVGRADPNALVGLVDRLHPDLLSVEELTPSFARKLRQVGIGSRLGHSVLQPQPGAGGAGLYSRLPLRPLAKQTHFFFRMPRVVIILPGRRRLRLVAVHPYPPLSGHVSDWQAALESLPSATQGTPWVLAGDFNGTFDQAEFRDVVDRGYADAGEVTGKGLEPTFPTMGHRMLPPSIAIDHVLADRRLGIADYGVLDLPGSDHRAIYAEVVLPRAGS
jgi:endonuclease/exonuclease/phosphatase (EEP) superfamily protein YafD